MGMNKYKHQNGFGIIELIISIVVLGVIAFIGWRVYESQNSSPKTSTQNEEQSQSPASEEKYAKYTDTEFGYQFEYPNTWKTSDEAAKMFESPESPTQYSTTVESQDLETSNEGIGYHLTKGAQMYVSVEPTTFATPEAFFNRNGFLPAVAKDKKDVTIDGVAGLSYRFSYEASNQLSNIVVKDGKLYSLILSYSDEAALTAYTTDYKALVASFKLPK